MATSIGLAGMIPALIGTKAATVVYRNHILKQLPWLLARSVLNGKFDTDYLSNMLNPSSAFDSFGNSLGINNLASSVAGKFLGTNLTGQQKEANQATLDMQKQSWQYNVEGMKEAGLNPALMYGSSSQPSVSSVSPSSPAPISELLELLKLPAEMKLISSQAEDLQASAEKKRSETTGQDISNEFASQLNQAEIESKRSASALSRAEISEVWQKIDESKANIQRQFKEVENIDSLMSLRAAEILNENANAYRIAELLPYEKLELSARSENERAAAQSSLAQAAYQNGLIDNGYIIAMCKSMNAEASIKDVEAYFRDPTHNPSSGIEHVVRSIESAVYNSVKFLSPMK